MKPKVAEGFKGARTSRWCMEVEDDELKSLDDVDTTCAEHIDKEINSTNNVDTAWPQGEIRNNCSWRQTKGIEELVFRNNSIIEETVGERSNNACGRNYCMVYNRFDAINLIKTYMEDESSEEGVESSIQGQDDKIGPKPNLSGLVGQSPGLPNSGYEFRPNCAFSETVNRKEFQEGDWAIQGLVDSSAEENSSESERDDGSIEEIQETQQEEQYAGLEEVKLILSDSQANSDIKDQFGVFRITVLLCCLPIPPNWGPTPFRFENIWLEHKRFKKDLEVWWREETGQGWAGYKFMRKLKNMRGQLKIWNKEVFGDTRVEKLIKSKIIAEIDRVEGSPEWSTELDEERVKLKDEVEI
ncbi:hypothetical protein L484_022988 [Morus notabilis]|uniref:Uncharacterized protein n=1 Tax=Morus notabilis TaxID=981085 RepID=W9S9C7_9ROSA|nr:hypothetical protein L484_022988 [Morus notabilis]